MLIERFLPSDWAAVREIYLEGIATGNATFETAASEWVDWDTAHLPSSRFVAKSGGAMAGWAALSPVSKRHVYRGVAEVSVYVAARARGRGVGPKLLAELIRGSEAAGIWTLQAGIFPENAASIRMHAKAGFRVLGIRERVCCMNGVWRNVTLLERRSSGVGV